MRMKKNIGVAFSRIVLRIMVLCRVEMKGSFSIFWTTIRRGANRQYHRRRKKPRWAQVLLKENVHRRKRIRKRRLRRRRSVRLYSERGPGREERLHTILVVAARASMGLAVTTATLLSAGGVEMIDITRGGDIQAGTIDVDTTSRLHKGETQLTSAAILSDSFGMVEIMWTREITDLTRRIHVTMFTVVDILAAAIGYRKLP
jgi:hypothetical protein